MSKMILEFSIQCSKDNSFKIYDEVKSMLDSYIKYVNLPQDDYLSLSSTNVREAEVMRVDTDGSKLYKE